MASSPARWGGAAVIVWMGACSPRIAPVQSTFVTGQSPSPVPVDEAFVGAEACAGCHASAAEAWRASAHSHARDTLRAAQAASNPDCLPCHVTGMGYPGGWAGSDFPALEHVGCESCHGPGAAHVANAGGQSATANAAPDGPRVGREGAGTEYGKLPRSAAACLPCHTATNSPDFVFDAYWARVGH